jgi:hypothetical protein
MYDLVGELRAGVTWYGNGLSRVRLVAAERPDKPGDEPLILEEGPAFDAMEDFGGGFGGQAELMRSAAIHLQVPGEGWLIAEDRNNEDISWQFYAANEIKKENRAGGGLGGTNTTVYRLQVGPDRWEDLPSECLPVRVWRPHQREHWRADSPTLSSLPILRTLELIHRNVNATLQSRLAANGIYWIPSEATFPANPRYEGAPDPFIAELMDVTTTAIKTPGSAAAAVPFFARMPAALIDALKHETFSSPLDEKILDLHKETVGRLASVQDAPAEVLLGMGDMNHWGAWQVEESALKTTVAATVELICWSLTCGWLWPALQAGGNRDIAKKSMVWYDLTELKVRPDRSQIANNMWQEGGLALAAALREAGFSETDVATSEDYRVLAGLKFLTQPLLASEGLRLLGVTTNIAPITGTGQTADDQPETNSNPTDVAETQAEGQLGKPQGTVPQEAPPDTQPSSTTPPAPANGAAPARAG